LVVRADHARAARCVVERNVVGELRRGVRWLDHIGIK
jgi:hypothetical protein